MSCRCTAVARNPSRESTLFRLSVFSELLGYISSQDKLDLFNLEVSVTSVGVSIVD